MSEHIETGGGGAKLARPMQPENKTQSETGRKKQTPFFSRMPVPQFILPTGERVEGKVVAEEYLPNGRIAYRVTAPPERRSDPTKQDQQNTEEALLSMDERQIRLGIGTGDINNPDAVIIMLRKELEAGNDMLNARVHLGLERQSDVTKNIAASETEMKPLLEGNVRALSKYCAENAEQYMTWEAFPTDDGGRPSPTNRQLEAQSHAAAPYWYEMAARFARRAAREREMPTTQPASALGEQSTQAEQSRDSWYRSPLRHSPIRYHKGEPAGGAIKVTPAIKGEPAIKGQPVP